MAHGGKRNGSGRKPGSPTLRSVEIASRLMADGGVSPLQVMLEAMRKYHDAGDVEHARAVAKDAAPYVHPRLAAVQLEGAIDHTLEVAYAGDFYTRLKETPDRPAISNGPPTAGAPEPCQDESCSVRAEVGKNGAGAA